jgi:hypothetical protein
VQLGVVVKLLARSALSAHGDACSVEVPGDRPAMDPEAVGQLVDGGALLAEANKVVYLVNS